MGIREVIFECNSKIVYDALLRLCTKVVNIVPVPAVPAGMYRISMHTDIENQRFVLVNTGRTGHTSQFRAIPAGTEKSFLFFKFCNF